MTIPKTAFRHVQPPWAAAVTFVACILLYGILSADRRAYGDAFLLVDCIERPRPYYNALYVPLGYAFHTLVGSPLGLGEWASLRWLSVISAAFGCAVLAWEAGRRLRSGALFAAWMLISVTAPALVFFATLVEVHAVQFAGASAALLLALGASRTEGPRSGVLLACGALLASASHVLGAFLVPALIVLAWRGPSARGLPPRTALWAVPLSLAAPLLVNLTERKVLESLGQEDFSPSLLQVGSAAAVGLPQRGWFGLSETVDWVTHEVVLACGFTLAALLVACFRWRDERRLTFATLLALAPVVLVLPQTGIRENGAYVLSSLPPLLILGSAMLARYERLPSRQLGLVVAVAALLGGVQYASAAAERGKHPTEDELLDWTARTASDRRLSGLVYVSSMARGQALAHAGIDVRTSCPMKVIERVPRARHPEVLQGLLLQVLGAIQRSEHVYIDAELVRGSALSSSPTVASLIERLGEPPSSLVPTGSDFDSDFYEVVLP